MFHGLTKEIPTNLKYLFFSTLTSIKLCPYWITGFSDAESNFSIRITKDKKRKTGWRILSIFSIELHKRDILLLRRIKTFFGVGIISERKNGNIVYFVQSFEDLTKAIIPHFDKYSLLTQKKADFLLFKSIIELLNSKVQASTEGLQKIINIRASMNKGLSKELNLAFPNTVPVSIPVVNFNKIIHDNWLIGFVDGEGCFYIKIKKVRSLLGFQTSISFFISQHSRDELLLNKIAEYLGCGNIEKISTRPNAAVFVVYKLNDICEKVIPFFQNYSLQSVKLLDYKDFCKVSSLMLNKAHLTSEGIKQINVIKSNMNKGRKYI